MYWLHPHFPGFGPMCKPQKQKSLEEKTKDPVSRIQATERERKLHTEKKR